MAEVLLVVSAVVGIAAGICTVLGYVEGWASRRRKVVVDGRRERTLSEGSEEVSPGPNVVEGEDEQVEPVNE